MACETTLVVESDGNNRRVDWRLLCEGKCADGKPCKPVRHGGEEIEGWERYTHECACKPQGEEPRRGECKLVVYEYVKAHEETKFKAKCLGHCKHNVAKPCRPFLIKEYRVAAVNNGDDFQFDLYDIQLHTIRHFKCICPDDFV